MNNPTIDDLISLLNPHGISGAGFIVPAVLAGVIIFFGALISIQVPSEEFKRHVAITALGAIGSFGILVLATIVDPLGNLKYKQFDMTAEEAISELYGIQIESDHSEAPISSGESVSGFYTIVDETIVPLTISTYGDKYVITYDNSGASTELAPGGEITLSNTN